jgi:hypothetical protein
MKDSLGFTRFVCLLCLLLVCFSLSGMARAAADKQFVSRVLEVAGVKLITRGRPWRTAHPAAWLCGDVSHVDANITCAGREIYGDCAGSAGIGESSIPADGLDMKTAAIRIHALAKSLGVEEARVVGHDRPRNVRNGSITFHHDQYPATVSFN